MPDRIDKNHPAMQKEIHARVDEALRSRGIDLSDPVRAELLSRADISYGYRDQPLLRFRAADRVFPSAGDCLDRLLSDSEHNTNTLKAPKRIAYTDREALFHVDVEKVAKGEISVFDDRTHPR